MWEEPEQVEKFGTVKIKLEEKRSIERRIKHFPVRSLTL
jgi:hypothetical protein